MKKFILLLVGISFMCSCSGPRKVVDFATISTLVEIHKKEDKTYKSLKNRGLTNLGLQALVTKHTEENRDIVDKIKQRYVNTNLILTAVGKLPQALSTIEDIHDYQSDILALVQEKPTLVAIAIQTELVILKRVNRLYNYVYLNAIVGTNFNRIPIAKRLQIVDFVIKELRVIRGFSYSILRKMKAGKNGNTLRQILQEFDFDIIYGDISKMQIINDVMPSN